MYAVIMTGGKQYIVKEGDVIRVERLKKSPGDKVKFENVLLVKTDKEVKVGTPQVKGAFVEGETIDERKGEKIIIFKYKRKKGYRRKKGHRQYYTEIKITQIHSGE